MAKNRQPPRQAPAAERAASMAAIKRGPEEGKDSTLEQFIHRLPKTETHLHIEGALPREFLRRLDPGKFTEPPPFWKKDYRFDSFAHFERELLALALPWYNSPERYHDAAQAVFARHLEQNVRYVETSFASGIIEFLGVPGPEIAAAIREAAPPGLEARIFMGIHRNGCGEKMKPVIQDSLHWPHLDGIDLHGDETLPLEDWTKPFYAEAKAAGKFLKAHAGECVGPESVRLIIEELEVTRIEHGVRAIEDADVTRLLTERGVTLDICPSSNVKLRVAPSMREHPIRPLFDAGIRCTISTDDPIIFGNTLSGEYLALAKELGFTRQELARLARCGFETALLPAAERDKHLADIAACAGDLNGV